MGRKGEREQGEREKSGGGLDSSEIVFLCSLGSAAKTTADVRLRSAGIAAELKCTTGWQLDIICPVTTEVSE